MVASHKPNKREVPSSNILSDEPPFDTDCHLRQFIILLTSLKWWWRECPDTQHRNDFYAVGSLNIYYSKNQKSSKYFRGPDFFVVLDTEYRERKSWVVWEEDNKYPNVIVELLSEETAEIDRGEKKEVYQNVFRTPEYFWFDPYSLEFKGFRLQENGEYAEIEANELGWLWSTQLEFYLGIVEEKLRFLGREGELIPTPTEAAIAEIKRTKEVRQQTERLLAAVGIQRAEEAEPS